MPRSILIPMAVLLCLSGSPTPAQQTPPVLPKIQETPLPPPVELPAPSSVPSDVPNRPLTAEEAARVALFHQPSVTVARAGVTAAQGRVRSARSGLLPSLSVGAGHTDVNTSGTSVNSGPSGPGTTGYQVSASVRQLLFDFDHTRDLARQATAQQRSASANLTRVQSDLVLQVKQAFYTYAQNSRLVRVNEENVRRRQDHLALAEARLKSGMGLPSDVVRAETAVADGVFSLNLARTGASLSRVALAQLMGIDPRTPVEVADSGEPPITADDPDALVDRALKQRPEIVQVRSSVEAARSGVSAARTANSPSLGASAGWQGRGVNLPANDSRSMTLGLSVQWSLWDAGLTAGRVTEAVSNQQASEAQMDSTRLAVISDVSQAYLSLKTAEQRVVTADAQVANAQEALRLTEGRYRAGVGTFVEVLDAQAALLTADTNRVNAESAVNLARANLFHALGMRPAALGS